MAADPNVNATLSQTINGLTVGDGYLLTFYWATAELDDVNTGPTTEQLDVSLGSQSQATQTLSTMTQGFDPWREVTMYFSATSTSETLSFLAAGTPAATRQRCCSTPFHWFMRGSHRPGRFCLRVLLALSRSPPSSADRVMVLGLQHKVWHRSAARPCAHGLRRPQKIT